MLPFPTLLEKDVATQEVLSEESFPQAPPEPPIAITPPMDVAEECTYCDRGLLGNLFVDGPGCSCGGGHCVPGQEPCYPCKWDHPVGRFLCGLYACICCPDPCYEPRWTPIADSAFFVETARPKAQQRIRWDSGKNLVLPDRSEYFWARADGNGKGPAPPASAQGETVLHYDDLVVYTEAATGNIGVFTEIVYRTIDPAIIPHASGFSDMNIGTKTLLFDCELLQISLIFRTYLPIGNFRKGLGVGHVSLEPSLVIGVKLGPETYFQGQVAEWIPIGGDPEYAGSILHYHFSLNQVLYRVLPDVPLIGTFEFSGWSFQSGEFTDPILGPGQLSSRDSYFYLGGGLRLFICEQVDFGFGAAFTLTQDHFAEQLFRTEFRFRF